MSLILIALAAAAATPATTSADIQMRTVGGRTPNRADMQRCHWSATVGSDQSRTVSGSEQGACVPGQALGERVLARYNAGR